MAKQMKRSEDEFVSLLRSLMQEKGVMLNTLSEWNQHIKEERGRERGMGGEDRQINRAREADRQGRVTEREIDR